MGSGRTLPPCAAACAGGQLELFAGAPAVGPAPLPTEFDWDAQHFVVVGHSGGKDSSATLHTVCERADKARALHKIRVLHCDLGKTARGHLIEWPGAADLARRQAAVYGVPFAVRRSARWDSLWHRIMAHGNWPGIWARFCTSDLKTVVGRDYIDELGREMGLSEPIRAGYVLGMRAEESTNRAKMPVIARHRMSGKGTLRVVTNWLPIHGLTEAQVWQLHQDHNIERHIAYELKMRRLSCRMCPLAAREDLVLSAQLNPDVAHEYAAAEQALQHPFRKNLSMARIIELAGI